MIRKLSIEQARRLAVVSQGVYCLSGAKAKQAKTNTVDQLIEHLSYVQIDTISVVQRAHHHVLWTRLSNYQAHQLEEAVAQKKVFEYWSHAAAYLPMRDFRYSLPAKHKLAAGAKHWHEKDPKQAAYVLDAIRERGPMMARDFKQERSIKNPGWGDRKPAKQALERLFMEGELMIVRRDNFQKVFDLSERVLPSAVDMSTPSPSEFIDYLIFNFLNAHGFANAQQMAYLRKGMKTLVQHRCDELAREGRIVEIIVRGENYYALVNYETQLVAALPRKKIKIMSPFDNLLIQRKRLLEIFDFDYQLECYVPAAKRKYGYFVLPILQGSKFIARMEARVDRKTASFELKGLWFEGSPKADQKDRVMAAISDFAKFNQSRFDIDTNPNDVGLNN